MKLAKRIQNVKPSVTLKITAKANKLKAEGARLVSFGVGEPDFNTPQYIIDGALAAIEVGHTKYTPSGGILPLKQAIAHKLLKDNGLKYSPDQIVVSNGAKHSLFNAIQALVEEGDEVIIPTPFWLSYPEIVALSGGKSVFIECGADTDFKVTPNMLERAITKNTKAFILNSPSNPTGAVYTREELLGLVEVLKRYENIVVISDEIYEKLVYGVEFCSIASLDKELKERTIVINGMSKTYAMTGWRIGYLAAPKEIAQAIDGMQSHATSNACSISQYAALAALSDDTFEKKMLRVFSKRRELLYLGIKDIAGLNAYPPRGAFYVWVDVTGLFGRSYGDTILDSAATVAETMLDEGVAVVPGEAFGSAKHIRLSYTVSEADLREGIDCIKRYIARLS